MTDKIGFALMIVFLTIMGTAGVEGILLVASFLGTGNVSEFVGGVATITFSSLAIIAIVKRDWGTALRKPKTIECPHCGMGVDAT
jgi:hypothetical protein